MSLSRKNWNKYVARLSAINKTARIKMQAWIDENGIDDVPALVSVAFALTTAYGEAASSAACQMYDETASLEGVSVPPAEPKPTQDIKYVDKAIRDTLERAPSTVPGTVSEMVKRTGAETTLKNAIRDGAYFAWVPNGDTCPFCVALASNGWRRASKKVANGDHADHIHQNCDCEFAISFKGPGNIEGYDPDKYLAMYEGAEGRTWKDKVNAMRRAQYASNKKYINMQKRAAYARRRIRIKETGGHHYIEQSEWTKADLKAAEAYEKYARVDNSKTIAENTGFSRKQIQQIQSHVFFNKHDLYEGRGRFEPDYNMAIAWKRLIEGDYLPRDITLLQHELLESKLEKMYNLTASEAHRRATEQYDWWKQLMQETKGGGEKDGLL